jgi:hypothetical protein
MILNDTNGGFQQFLGADTVSAASLVNDCDLKIQTEDVLFTTRTKKLIGRGLERDGASTVKGELKSTDLEEIFIMTGEQYRFLPQMLDGVSEWVRNQVQSGVKPSEIAILTPYLSSALKLALSQRLGNSSIPFTILASSTPLIDEPFTKALIDLFSLVQKPMVSTINRYDQSLALMQMVKGLDFIRSCLIWERVSLDSMDYLSVKVDEELASRIPDQMLQKSIFILDWLGSVEGSASFANTITRLFDEVLSQPGFSAETDQSRSRLVSQLIESYNKFVAAMPRANQDDTSNYNEDFVDALRSGLISAQYIEDYIQALDESGVLIAPAMTFLTRNRVVDYQVWLNIGSDGWYRRLEQPLTNPFVLSRNWPKGKEWDADEEIKASESLIGKVTSGLITRCRKQILLGFSQYGETGVEEQGLLLRRLQYLYRVGRSEVQHD